ncbi:MAG: DUF4968 domain-containing protein, partial [Bacteroidia bacterium]|nr:DUF4968 domain-containing protein [Bacteroidia bacterium]
MKRFALILSAAIIAAALTGCGKKAVSIDTPEGTIVITALTSNSVRVQMAGDLATPELEELVYVNKVKTPSFKVAKSDEGMALSLDGISVRYDKAPNTLTFIDAEGQVVLKESARKVVESQVSGVPCYDVTESFETAADE